MPLHHLVVTPLPNGRSGNTLSLSVHLSPRLREKGVLADYPDFADWGSFVTTGPGLQFQPLINGPCARAWSRPSCRRRSIRRCGRPCSATRRPGCRSSRSPSSTARCHT